MSYQRVEIPESDIQRQLDICAQLRAHFSAGGRQPLAMVDTLTAASRTRPTAKSCAVICAPWALISRRTNSRPTSSS